MHQEGIVTSILTGVRWPSTLKITQDWYSFKERNNLAVHTIISMTTTEQPSSEEKNILQAIVPRRSGLWPRSSLGPSLYAPSKRPAQNISGIDFFSVADTKRNRKKAQTWLPQTRLAGTPKTQIIYIYPVEEQTCTYLRRAKSRPTNTVLLLWTRQTGLQ